MRNKNKKGKVKKKKKKGKEVDKVRKRNETKMRNKTKPRHMKNKIVKNPHLNIIFHETEPTNVLLLHMAYLGRLMVWGGGIMAPYQSFHYRGE